jgi:hypothetical protein
LGKDAIRQLYGFFFVSKLGHFKSVACGQDAAELSEFIKLDAALYTGPKTSKMGAENELIVLEKMEPSIQDFGGLRVPAFVFN